jgi:phthalate 4,5-cis-dihydrodiol dehydrogenase
MINVGIIGAGFWGEKHADAIQQLPGVRLVASNRTNSAALQSFTDKYGGRGYTRYQDLLKDKEVEAVVITTPHHLHTQILVEAAQAGKHILLEKPMAPNLEECDRMIQASTEHSVTFMVGHTNHFVPVYMTVKRLLESGEFGDPVMIVDRTLKRWWAPNRRDWHLDRDLGGGMWMTIGVHNVDRMVWLTGSRVQSVSAHLDTCFHNQRADDIGSAFLRFENGIAGTAITVGYKTGAPCFDTEIVCTNGLIRVDKMGGISIAQDETWRRLPQNRQVGPDSWMEEAMIFEWQAFLSAIETGEQPEVTGEFARHIMAVIFAAEQSSKEKREISVPA